MKRSILLMALCAVGGTAWAGHDEIILMDLVGRYREAELALDRALKNLRNAEQSNSLEKEAERQKAYEEYETATKNKEQLLLKQYKLAAYVRDEACEE